MSSSASLTSTNLKREVTYKNIPFIIQYADNATYGDPLPANVEPRVNNSLSTDLHSKTDNSYVWNWLPALE